MSLARQFSAYCVDLGACCGAGVLAFSPPANRLSSLTWAKTSSMKQSRFLETMTLVSNGQVLVAGGETFDKSTGRFVPIARA